MKSITEVYINPFLGKYDNHSPPIKRPEGFYEKKTLSKPTFGMICHRLHKKLWAKAQVILELPERDIAHEQRGE